VVSRAILLATTLPAGEGIDETFELKDGGEVTITGQDLDRTLTFKTVSGDEIVITGRQILHPTDPGYLSLSGGTINGEAMSASELQDASGMLSDGGVNAAFEGVELSQEDEERNKQNQEKKPPVERGKYIGNYEDRYSHEKEIIDILVQEGKIVKEIPTGTDKTPDFDVDGIRTELKSLLDVRVTGNAKKDANHLSAAISKRSIKARDQAKDEIREQSADVIINVRNQKGVTEEIALRGIRRAFGGDASNRIRSIRIVGKNFNIHKFKE
jgi:hypothetical protein